MGDLMAIQAEGSEFSFALLTVFLAAQIADLSGWPQRMDHEMGVGKGILVGCGRL